MRKLDWRERGWLCLRLGLRLGIFLLACFFVLKLAPPLLRLCMPFVVALVLTWILEPMVNYLERRLRMRRGAVSLALVLLALVAAGTVVSVAVYSLVSQVLEVLQNWESWGKSISEGISALAQAVDRPLSGLPGVTYDRLVELGDSLAVWVGDTVSGMLSAAASRAGNMAMSLPTWIISVVICVMATYFISADYPRLRQRAARYIPREFRGFLSHVKRVARDAFGGYVKAQLILSGGVFLILLIGFVLTRERYALLLAFVLAVMDFIPIIGSGTAMIPWAVVDLAMGKYAHAVGLLVIWGVIAVFRRLAEPRVVGDQTGLSPIASLVSIYVGMRLGGVPGMVLGPVICLTAITVIRGGAFAGTQRDLRLAMGDISAILNAGPEPPEK